MSSTPSPEFKVLGVPSPSLVRRIPITKCPDRALQWLPPLPSPWPARCVAPPGSPTLTHTRLTLTPRRPRPSASPTSRNTTTTTATALACPLQTLSPTQTRPHQTQKTSSLPVPSVPSSGSASLSTPTASPSRLATVRGRGEKKTSHMAHSMSPPQTRTLPSIPSARSPLPSPLSPPFVPGEQTARLYRVLRYPSIPWTSPRTPVRPCSCRPTTSRPPRPRILDLRFRMPLLMSRRS